MSPKSTLITITDAASNRIKNLIQGQEEGTYGIIIGVKSGGCANFKYTFNYAHKIYTSTELEGFEIVCGDDFQIFIEKPALLYILGTTLDFIQTELSSSFVFANPNAKGQCGCGESFNI